MFVKKKEIILIIFVFIHFFFNKLNSHDISSTNLKFENQRNLTIKKEKLKSILEKIEDKDKVCIEKLFRHLIVSQLIGYVVFGDKPIAWGDFFTKKYYVALKGKKRLFYYDSAWDDYLIWKKYEHLFLTGNYIFRVYKSIYDSDIKSFLFINKKNATKKIEENIHLFRNKLGNNFTPENLFIQLESKEDIIEEVFQGHESLLGILLGFGNHNSKAYEKLQKLDSLKGKPPFDFFKIKTMYQLNLTIFPQKEIEKNSLFNFIMLPHYVEDVNHPESKKLRREYLKLQKSLYHILFRHDFLEYILLSL